MVYRTSNLNGVMPNNELSPVSFASFLYKEKKFLVRQYADEKRPHSDIMLSTGNAYQAKPIN